MERKNLKSLIWKNIVIAEGFTYLLPVPLLFIFTVFNLPFAKNDMLFLLNVVGVFTIPFLITYIIIKYRYLKPMIQVLDNTGDEATAKEAKRRVLNLPLIDGLSAFLRYMIPFAGIAGVYVFLEKIQPYELISIFVLLFSTAIINFIYNFMITESVLKPFLMLSEIRSVVAEKTFSYGLTMKLATAIIIVVCYPISLFLLIIFLNVFGHIELSTNTLSIFLLTGLSIFFSVFIAYFLARSMKGTLKNMSGALELLTEGHYTGLKNLAVTTTDEFGTIAAQFNLFGERLRQRLFVLSQIGKGDLSAKISLYSANDEIGSDIEIMQTQLQNIIGYISSLTAHLSSGVHQISEASTHQSTGATEQASALEEILASINELTAQVRSNAHSSTSASELSNKVMEHVRLGNQETINLQQAMATISSSAEKIKKIVKVIDEIAFQTNMLALNASVEAARAGKYGKGFAVVADEVRDLANRSANNAKETSLMLEEALKNIANGYALANTTSQQLLQIREETQNVTELLSEISLASREQSMGLEQISTGLNQIGIVTQANTASSEETAAAAQELSAKAVELKDIVLQFKLEEGMKAIPQTIQPVVNNRR